VTLIEGKKGKLRKPMIIMLISVGVLFGGIFAYQAFKGVMIKKSIAKQSTIPISVSTTKAVMAPWQPKIKAVGSVRSIQGVDVTTELAGMVRSIYFDAGAIVKKGMLLVKLNDDTEVAQLHALEAAADLAKTTYARDKAQFDVQAVSQATLDIDAANVKSTLAQVAQQATIIDKKNIRAPFSGRLGISSVNEGQYINPGDKLATLQKLDPMYVDFSLPQQELGQIKMGQPVKVTTDAYPKQVFSGKITTINPVVDPATRNVQVEATVANPKQQLLQGMFTLVEIDIGVSTSYLTLPQTAISFNSYGEIAYIVEKTEQGLKARQTFVTLGNTREDQIAVLSGLKENDEVVTGGQLKLKNGSAVIINNDKTDKSH